MKRVLILVFLLFFGIASQAQKIDELKIEGLKRTKESFVRKIVRVKENTVYDSLIVANDIERLKRLPGIASASYTFNNKETDANVLTYNIVENFTIIPAIRISTANNGDFAFRLSVFEFNLLGNNQLVGGFYERDVFNSYGVYYEHPFLFSNKLGIGFSYKDVTTQEPIFFDAGDENYRFSNKALEGKLLFSFDFHNEAELGLSYINESYELIDIDSGVANPVSLQADKLNYRAQYTYVDIDIDYQYFDGFTSEFTAQYFQFLKGGDRAQEFLSNFLSLRNDFIYYKKIKQKGNWATRLRLAAAIGNENSPFAPFTLDNQLNIRGVGNTVDRGTAAIVLNTEYRQTLLEKGWFVVQGNAFVDAGSWRNPGNDISELFNGSSTKLYPGLGIRFIHKKIFNAVFRLDYGIGVSKNSTNGITFGIGQYF